MRRSTRVKTEPVEPEIKPAVTTPKNKKSEEKKPETSKRSASKLKSAKTEPETSPKSDEKRRKGRPATSSERKGVAPVNDAQDRKDLAEFKRAKAPKDILTSYTTEHALAKFFSGAIRAATNNELICPGCKKAFASHSGMVYHIQRCKESLVEWEATRDTLTYSEVKEHPWMWVAGSKRAKDEMAAAAFKETTDGVECVRAVSCGSTSFKDQKSLVEHLNSCCVPTYNQFRGEIEEFRVMDKKMRTTLIRFAMSANGGQLPCLSCGKMFEHKFGLAYHLDRCGFTEDNSGEIPWRCYRCGFNGKVNDRESHLEVCDVPASEAAKPKNQRVGKSEMDGDTILELSSKRRRTGGVSVANGAVPGDSSQTRFTASGLKRFKFRKSEAMQLSITIAADLEKYRASIESAIEEHEKKDESQGCEMLRRRAEMKKGEWKRVEEGSYIASLRDKKSIGMRQKTVDDFVQAFGKTNSNTKRTTIPPVVEHAEKPDGLTRITAFTSETVETPCTPSVSIGYAGGPIAATLLAPNPLSENCECLAVLSFPNDEILVDSTTGKKDWRQTDAYIQLWRVEKSKEEKMKKMGEEETREVTRCDLSLWFMLKIEGMGLALAANWMPRSESSDMVGFLAVAMSDGTIVIYCIRKDSVSMEGLKEDEIAVVCPQPILTLKAPTIEEVNSLRRTQREERRGEVTNEFDLSGERLTRSARAQMQSQTTAVVEGEAMTLPSVPPSVREGLLEDVKPMAGLMEMETNEEENGGSEIVSAPKADTGSVISTPVRRTKAEQRKELQRMRMAKTEDCSPPPPPPIIAVAWSPFTSCSSIAAVDAAGTVIVWELEENMILEGEEDALHPSRVFVDIEWVSPAINVAWMDERLLGVSFAERIIRVLNTTTGECQLEENTVRTAGKALMAAGSCFDGLFIYQSEYYNATEAPETAVVYLAYDVDREGYFVVPLTNRHGLMVWAVGVSSSGVIATAGADGRLQLSMNGKVVPRGCIVDLSVNLHTDHFLLIRNRVTKEEEEVEKVEEQSGSKAKNPLPPPVYASHDDVTDNMWLDIVCEDADTVSGPSLPQGLLDQRVESLNAVTLSSHSPSSPADHIVVTGGEAGLLFARSCYIEEKGVGSANWLNMASRKWSRTPSKESTPRPRSRASKEPTPKNKI
ncbi:hypothetical protein PFISCL1PPCAC_20370 [Pristionchus fissidentatus]|uniref:C2H2-type domain-containing protein n=1 Tax=Pristionchus fissidentatus TaxID=1538716 RepID=A0AAV5WC09_9BILA|nr:hypothetical protein PFISCL1PPCAC_20370 [Pristionchus fissidentatus]